MIRIQYVFLIFIVSLLASCGVDEFDDSIVKPEVYEPQIVYVNDILTKARTDVQNDDIKIECITVKFPFKLIDFNQNTYNINSIDAFNNLVLDSSKQIIDFVYPLEVIDNLGIENTVNNLWDFAKYAAGCYPQAPELSTNLFPAYVINETNSCYNIKYPITLSKIDGSFIVVEDERSFILKHASEPLYFVFPFSLVNNVGDTFIATDANTLLNLLLNCNLGPTVDSTLIEINAFNFIACYELVFPLEAVILGSATPFTITDSEVFSTVLLQGRFQYFIFPLHLKAASGAILTANNDVELDQLINACFSSGDLLFLLSGTPLGSDMPCYDLVFPIKVKAFNTSTIFQNYNQIEQMMQDSLFFQYNIDFPVSIKLKANGQQKTLQYIEDVFNTLVDCN